MTPKIVHSRSGKRHLTRSDDGNTVCGKLLGEGYVKGGEPTTEQISCVQCWRWWVHHSALTVAATPHTPESA